MQEKVQSILAELRRQFEELYGERLVQLVLYGSQARGDADPESDIDVLVVLRGPFKYGEEIERTGYVTAALSLENDVVLSRMFVTEKTYQAAENLFMRNVHRDGVPI